MASLGFHLLLCIALTCQGLNDEGGQQPEPTPSRGTRAGENTAVAGKAAEQATQLFSAFSRASS